MVDLTEFDDGADVRPPVTKIKPDSRVPNVRVRAEDRTGEKHGRWTVLSVVRRQAFKHGYNEPFAICRCECGTERDVYLPSLIKGKSNSCGCLAREHRQENHRESFVRLVVGDIGIIGVTGGHIAIVDIGNFERLERHSWFLVAGRYAGSHFGSDGKIATMHRLIMEPPAGLTVDHINGDGLDNRRVNLRVCTRAENSRNQQKQVGTSSRFKGVCWDKREEKWIAYIHVGGSWRFLGYYTDEINAARAYDAAAIEHFGEFACQNFSARSIR